MNLDAESFLLDQDPQPPQPRTLARVDLIKDGQPQPLPPPNIWDEEHVSDDPDADAHFAEQMDAYHKAVAAKQKQPQKQPQKQDAEAFLNQDDKALPAEDFLKEPDQSPDAHAFLTDEKPAAPEKSGVAAAFGGLEASTGSAIETAGRIFGSDKLTSTGEEMRQAGNQQQQERAPETTAGKVAEFATGSAPFMATPLALGAIGSMAGPVGAGAGFLLGAVLAAYGLSTGDLYNALVQAKVDPEKAAKYAATGAVPLAALYSIPPTEFVGKLLSKPATDAVVKGIVRRMAEGVATEAATMGAVGATGAVYKEAVESKATGQTMADRGGLGRIGEEAGGMALGSIPFGVMRGARAPEPVKKGPPETSSEPPPPGGPAAPPGAPAGPAGEFEAKIPDFIKPAAGAAPAEGVPQAEGPRTFKIDEPMPLAAAKAVEVEPAGVENPINPLDEEKKGIPKDTTEALQRMRPDVSRDLFNREVSKQTKMKGVQVFDTDGGEASYDPLTKTMSIGRDIDHTTADPAKIAALATAPEPEGWRKTPLSVDLEDGSSTETTAAVAAKAIGERIRKAMQVMTCLGS